MRLHFADKLLLYKIQWIHYTFIKIIKGELIFMTNRMILNETSYIGAGAIENIVTEAKTRGYKKALVVTDKDLIKFNVASKVTKFIK